MSENPVRVRFAPSPTGPLHMGGVRTALYNYLFAKKHGGTFILRIEDTDQTRFVPGAQEYIIDALKWCGIEPTEGPGLGGDYGPYVQSERQAMYMPYAQELVINDKAYYAFDTAEELDKMRDQAKSMGMPNWQYNSITRTNMKNSLTLSADEVQKRLDAGEPYVIRMKMPRNVDIRFEDIIRGWVVVNTNNLDDKVLFKSDGMPTYHLANIVDDHTMAISHVIRGEEWLPSAPLHVMLYEAFGWEAPKFAHLPLLLRPDGNGKLSKRDGDRLGFPVFPTNWLNPDGEMYSGYRENGYFREAFINMLAFLGWNPGTHQEIFSLKELEESFSLERVSKAGAKFDPDKTRWFQQQYLRSKTDEELAHLMLNELILSSESKLGRPVSEEIKTKLLSEQRNLNDSKSVIPLEKVFESISRLPSHLKAKTENLEGNEEIITKFKTIAGLMKERSTFVKDILTEGDYLLNAPEQFDAETINKKWKPESGPLMEEWLGELNSLNTFDASSIETAFKAFLEKKSLGIGAVLPLFRLLVTGKGMGPSMFEIAAFLGKEECLTRMSAGLKNLN